MFGIRDAKEQRLTANEALVGYTRGDLATLASLGDELAIAAGGELTVEGGYGGEAFLVLEGEVEVNRGTEHVATLGPGAFVGEMALLDHQPRSASVIALSDVRVLVFDPRSFSKLLHDSPNLARRLTQQVTGRLRAAERAPQA